MSVTSIRYINLVYSGDIAYTQGWGSTPWAQSVAKLDIVDLASGANSLLIPALANVGPTGLTIIPPVGNVQTITLKGAISDVGIPLHKTDPTSIGINAPSVIYLFAGGPIPAIRLIWS